MKKRNKMEDAGYIAGIIKFTKYLNKKRIKYFVVPTDWEQMRIGKKIMDLHLFSGPGCYKPLRF